MPFLFAAPSVIEPISTVWSCPASPGALSGVLFTQNNPESVAAMERLHAVNRLHEGSPVRKHVRTVLTTGTAFPNRAAVGLGLRHPWDLISHPATGYFRYMAYSPDSDAGLDLSIGVHLVV